MSILTARSGVVSLALLCMASLALGAGCASEDGASAAAAIDGNTADFAQDIKSKTDAQVQAEIEAAAVGANFTSESDFPFHYVSATLKTKLSSTKAVTEMLVRAELASFVDGDPDTDKPLAKLVGMSKTFTEWRKDFTPASGGCTDDVSPSAADCAAVTKMNDAIAKNLRGVRVYYFGRNGRQGHVDGVAVSVLIVGRTPSGNLAGVRTIAIWT